MTWKHIPTANHNKTENKVLVCNRRRQAFLFYVSGVAERFLYPTWGYQYHENYLSRGEIVIFFYYCFAMCLK